ncbi:hypothetical protein TNCV_4676311 [Trichonephila clavipes]|nr:hypothetical protein TNCV_4676311 [Trichonephila clavipes]
MDSNSKSELWLSPYSESRRDKLCEFISANNLCIINEDCGPTFRATQGTSCNDVTIVGSETQVGFAGICAIETLSSSGVTENIWAPLQSQVLGPNVEFYNFTCVSQALEPCQPPTMRGARYATALK